MKRLEPRFARNVNLLEPCAVRLRHRRLARELARSRLSSNRWAQKMGLASGHLSEIVNGKRLHLAPKTRQKLLDALGLPFEELFEIGHERRSLNPKKPMRSTIPERKGDGLMLKALPNLRFAVRSLAKRPTFTAAAVLTLAVGIAANTTLFSFVNSVLVRPSLRESG